MIIVRYADDIGAGPRVRPSVGPRTCFEHEADAHRCLDMMRTRGSLFNFLGFTFISGKDRRDNFQL
jgi:hypothetical protein